MNSKEPAALSQLQNTQTTENTYTLMETDIPAIKADLTLKDIQSITAYVPGD